MRIGVVTVSLPERHEFRAECIRRVEQQTLRPVIHAIGVDHERVGVATMLNRMLPSLVAADCEWVAQIADDDIMYPQHLERLAAHSADADIVYSYCDVEGRDGFGVNETFDATKLRHVNYIPATTLIRTSLCVELGWDAHARSGYEDHDFWLRALDHGARFACVQEHTWLYRFHGANLSFPR